MDPPDRRPSWGTVVSPGRVLARTILWISFSAAAIAALILGYLGMRTYLHAHGHPGNARLDVLYYDLQLFVLGSDPLSNGGPYPATLEFARFAAPAVTVYAVAETARLVFASELGRLRVQWARGHAIVCGDGPVAQSLATRLKKAGRFVVVVGREPAERPFVAGDPRRAEVLRRAGIDHAAVLYACTEDSAVNTTVALAARQRIGSRPLSVYVRVRDTRLCAALRARRLGLPEPSAFRLDFFNLEELAARELLAEKPYEAPADRPHGVVIIGMSDFGGAVLVELARRWRLRGSPCPLAVTLVDPAAGERLADLVGRYAFLPEACRISTATELPGLDRPPHRVYVCHDDEELALKTALTVTGLWHGGPGSVMVRLDRLAPLAEAFHGGDARLLDEVSGVLHMFGVVSLACVPDLIEEDLIESLARVIHEYYVLDRIRGGDPAVPAWDHLPETLKRANRAAAEDIGRKLTLLGCVIAPRGDGEDHFAFHDGEVEKLAHLEHLRWSEERTADGWTHGPVRDDAAGRHPDLVDWNLLPDGAQEKDRQLIRNLPAILADAGFQIVRI